MLPEISLQQSGHQLAQNARNQEHGARRATRAARAKRSFPAHVAPAMCVAMRVVTRGTRTGRTPLPT